MGFDTAYEAISENTEDHRWAFGTGFADPLSDVDTTVPAGVDGAQLRDYCLMLADDALVLSHRLQQWLTRAPELEEETALANIGLDLLGQARALLTRAGQVDGSGRDEDAFAFGRAIEEFRNVRFVEPFSADFAELVVRLLAFTTWRLAVLARLRTSSDPVLAAVAAKAVNELAYHREYAAGWVIRLGDGTAYSRRKTLDALDTVLAQTPELFAASPAEALLARAGIAVDPGLVRAEVDGVLATVLAEAGLPALRPQAALPALAGRDGRHTAAMVELLEELQSLARAHPGAVW